MTAEARGPADSPATTPMLDDLCFRLRALFRRRAAEDHLDDEL